MHPPTFESPFLAVISLRGNESIPLTSQVRKGASPRLLSTLNTQCSPRRCKTFM